MTLLEKLRLLAVNAYERVFSDRLIQVHVFREMLYAPERDAVVCIVLERSITRYISIEELDHAFSGFVKYHKLDGTQYIGVWGQRNASRLRRFLRERGAQLTIIDSKPQSAKMKSAKTVGKRRRIRSQN